MSARLRDAAQGAYVAFANLAGARSTTRVALEAGGFTVSRMGIGPRRRAIKRQLIRPHPRRRLRASRGRGDPEGSELAATGHYVRLFSGQSGGCALDRHGWRAGSQPCERPATTHP